MAESSQHGSRDEHRNGDAGDRRSGAAHGLRSGGDRGGYGGDRRTGTPSAREGVQERRGGDVPWGDRREDDRGRGYRGRRDDRRGDRRDERRGGDVPRGDRREDDRGRGYRGRRDDRREGFPERSGGFHDRRDDRVGASTHRHPAPEIDDDITGRELDKPTRAQLGALEPRNADTVAKHLVMAGRYLLDDPELALQHAQAAGRRGGRIAAVREATGLAAYEAGDYALALKELRTFRRMTGAEVHLPLMVDCERALGRLDKAVELATSEAAASLEPSERVELAIVLAGIRRDRGDAQGAVNALTIPQLDKNRGFSYSPRLFRAYAETLRGVGRDHEALTWDRQAVVAEAALGTGQFAEPEIVDLDDEDGRAPATGVALADAEESTGDNARAGGTAPVGDPGDGVDDEAGDVLDKGGDDVPVDAGGLDPGEEDPGDGVDDEAGDVLDKGGDDVPVDAGGLDSGEEDPGDGVDDEAGDVPDGGAGDVPGDAGGLDAGEEDPDPADDGAGRSEPDLGQDDAADLDEQDGDAEAHGRHG